MQGLKQLARGYRNRDHGIAMRVPWPSVAFLAGAALLGGVALIGWDLDVLLLWGAISLVLTLIYTWVLFKRKERTVLGEWVGIAGLTVSTAVVWSAGTGTIEKEALLLWIVAFLYFGGTVPYVKLRVRQMKSKGLSLPARLEIAQPALVYTAISLVAVALAGYQKLLPWLVVVPFALSLSKVIWAVFEDRGPKKIAHIGYSEAVLSTVFAILTIAAFCAAR
jgi:4-hydroxybenzoate polyprenyltransferase